MNDAAAWMLICLGLALVVLGGLMLRGKP